MTTPKFTDAPWLFSPDKFNRPDDDHAMGSIITHGDDPWFICEIEDANEWEANARLIAAAPDLFVALTEMLVDYGSADESGKCAILARANAALAKVES